MRTHRLDEAMVPSAAVRVHAKGMARADSGDPADEPEKVDELPGGWILVLLSHLVHRLAAHLVVHSRNLIAMLLALVVYLLSRLAPFYEPYVRPTISSLTGCVSHS